MTKPRLLAALSVAMILAASCGTARGADKSAAEVGGPTDEDKAPTVVDDEDDFVLPPTTSGAPPKSWVEHRPGDDCRCADGSEFSYWTHEGSSDKVVVFLQGGATCTLASTCAFDSGAYTIQASSGQATGTDAYRPSGIFDLLNPANPLADWTFVFVPHCTGDSHLGNNVASYDSALAVNHVGLVNSRHALEHVLENYPGTREILVTGSGAGAVPAPLFGGILADALPAARVTVLADSTGAYPDVPSVGIGSAWGAFASVPLWPVNLGLQAGDWTIPKVFVQTGRHNPAIKLARYDAAYDAVQQQIVGAAGINGDLLTLIQGNELQIEATSGVDVTSYIAPGDAHTILDSPHLYDLEVDGYPFVTWLGFLVAGEDPGDVACDGCLDSEDEATIG